MVTKTNPTVAKTFGAGAIADGATTTLVFTLTNSGTSPAQSAITLGDTLPTGLALNSATPAVAYSAGCSGPATGTYNAGTRVISGLTGIAMTAGTASCTVTLSGLTNQATQTNASCVGNPAAFTNLAANVTATNATPGGSDQCVVVTKSGPTVAKTFGAGTIADGAATTLVFTLTNNGTNPAQSAITLGDTLPTGLALNSATPAVAYSAGCSGPVTATYTAGTRVISGLAGVAMTSGTASCTVTLSGLTNQATQTNASCVGNPAAFTNLAANVTATNATPGGADQCLVVTKATPAVAKTFGAGTIADGATTTLVLTLTNSGTNPAQSAISLGDTLPTGLALNSATPAVAYSAGCSGPATATYTAGTRVLSGLTGIAMTAGTASCSVTLSGLTNQATQTNASCVGNPAAFTNLAANVTATNATPGGGDQCLVVTKSNPTVAKTFGSGTIADGATTTLVLTLTNSGTNPAQAAITLGDTLPTGLALNSATPAVAYSAGCSGPATAAYNAGTRVLSGLTGVAMASGTASCTVTLAGLTNAAAQTNASCVGNPAAFTNLAANVTATNATPGGADQCLVVTKANPTVAKTFGAGTIADSAATTLVFTLANTGTNPAQSAITLGDTLPTGLALNSATPAVAYSAGCSGPATGAYNAGTRVISGLTGIAMTAGTASCTVTLSGLTNAASQVNASCVGNPAAFTNLAANVTATNATPGGADQCLVVTKTNPSVAKTFGIGSIADGAATTLVFTLSNTGTNPAQSAITVGDTLPASLRLNSATPAVAYSAGCSGPATGAYNAGTRVISGLTGIAMTAGTASCTVTVSGLTNAASQVNASCVGNPAAFTNLAANVTATNATPGGADQCLVVTKANPTVAKTFGAGTIADGAATTLIFTLTNSGTNPAQAAITLGDTLPTGLALNSATPAVAYSAGCSGPATATYTAGTRVISGLTGVAMTAGTGSCTVTLSGLSNQATQTNASCVGNPAAFTNLAANVTATNATPGGADQCLVVTKANPTVAKTFGAGTIADGAATTLVFTLTNNGTNPAQSAITLGDTLPTGLALNSATPAVAYSAGCSGPATATYTVGTRVISGLAGIAMASGTASCSVTLSGLTNAASQVNASCVGNPAAFTNLAANVTATNATPGGADQCLVVTKANPTVAKTFGTGTIADGATTTLVFTLTNNGTNPAQSAITLGDTLPASLRLNSATPAVAYSAGCSGPATATYTVGTRVVSGLTGIAMSAGTASCTVTLSGLTNVAAQTNASCVGNPAAFTNLAANVTATNATPGGVDQCLVVNAAVASLTKAFSPTPIDQGATSTLVFTLANSGTNPAQSGINFVDTLPANVSVAGAPNVQSNCPAGGALAPAPAFVSTSASAITVTGAAMNAGVASCEIRVNVTSNVPGSYANTNAANITGAANITTTGVSATLVVQALPAITKAFGAAALGIGQTTTLAFTIDNTGTNAANRAGLAFTDTLPAGLETANPPLATASAGCLAPTLAGTANASAAIGASSFGVNAGQVCTVTFTLRATTTGTKTNDGASVVTTGILNNVTPQVVTVVQASLDKAFSPTTINVGQTSTLTFTLTNGAGNPAQAGISFSDSLPGNVIVAATPNVQTNCPAGAGFGVPGFTVTAAAGATSASFSSVTMTSGVASCQVRVDVTSNVAGVYTNNSANVTAAGITNSVTPSTLTVNAAAPTITKAFAPGTIASGATSTLTITIANTNNVPVTVTSVTDTFPTTPGAGLVRAATPAASTTCASGSVTHTAGSVTLTGGTVPANGSCSFRIDVQAANAGTYTNTIAAGALTSTAGANTAPASANLIVTPVANLGVVKSGPATVGYGATATYTIVVSNAGPDAANSASFSDVVPAKLGTVAGSCGSPTGGAACGAVNVAGNAVTSTITTLPSGGSVTFTVSGVAIDIGSFTNTATIAPPAGTTDPVAANDSSSVSTTILAPDLTITKAHAGNFTVGTNGTYTITVTNAGTLATSGTITVTDTLPTGLGFVSANGTGWACANAAGTVTCTTASVINPAASAPAITLVVSVASVAAPAVTNFASVGGGNEPPALANNNQASDNTIVVAGGREHVRAERRADRDARHRGLLSAHVHRRPRGQRELRHQRDHHPAHAGLDAAHLPRHQLQRRARRCRRQCAAHHAGRRGSGRHRLHRGEGQHPGDRALQFDEQDHGHGHLRGANLHGAGRDDGGCGGGRGPHAHEERAQRDPGRRGRHRQHRASQRRARVHDHLHQHLAHRALGDRGDGCHARLHALRLGRLPGAAAEPHELHGDVEPGGGCHGLGGVDARRARCCRTAAAT